MSVSFTMAIFLIAAHIAFVRFAPMLSSEPMAATINRIAGYPASESASDPAAMRATLIIYGDQSDGASVLFYTRRQALLVHGRSSTMLWGSMWPDAPHVFIDDKQLTSIWGTGNRKFLFAQGGTARSGGGGAGETADPDSGARGQDAVHGPAAVKDSSRQ